MVKPLAPDDEAVLDHVLRYRLTLPTILAKTGLLSEAGEDAARTTLERLIRDGWLRTADLYPGHRSEPYYHLSEQGAEALQQDVSVAQPLKAEARAEWYAIATFCCCGESFRELLTKREFQEKFSKLWFTGQPTRYYLDRGEDGVVRLAFLKVDTAGPGRWDRLIDSCAKFLRQRTDQTRVAAEHHPHVAEFARLVKRDQFQFTVLTALPEKQRAIELELDRRQRASEPVPPLRVHVVPGLFEVLFPAPSTP
ncbi:MAG: hypothetical protein SH850_02875 [Planctomycetaceae bacterium]|nr:hypothetical protein [Planctomycetaceae bacterium]